MKRNELRKPYLFSYSVLEDFPQFISEVEDMSEAYRYVSVSERRCFNIMVRFKPNIKNMISNAALLLQYKDIIDFYVVNFRFPKILLVDDIIIHGRGLSKLLFQFEQLLSQELENRGYLTEPEEKFEFRYKLACAIDIYVYAKNRGTVFIEDRYLTRIKCLKLAYAGELRDISLQLSDALGRWEVANTSFVYSLYSKQLSKILESYGSEINNTARTWKRIKWEYRKETMVLYVKMFGNATTNRISTIRTFPGRTNNREPLFTSFTLLGDISESLMDHICTRIKEILKEEQCEHLCNILSMKGHPVLQQCKGQLVSYILSVIDMFDFIREVDKKGCVLECLKDDTRKIAQCFGLQEDLYPELAHVIEYIRDDKRIEASVYPLLDGNVMPLLDFHPNFLNRSMNEEKTYHSLYCRINDAVREIFYNIGLFSEKTANELVSFPHRFRPEIYQEYSNQTVTTKSDGVVSFKVCFDLLKERLMDFDCIVYFCIAAFILLMDNGVMSVKSHYSKDDSTLIALVKAGEMATFFVPDKLSIFVPAFALIERECIRINMGGERAIVRFFTQYVEKGLSYPEKEIDENNGLLISVRQVEICTNHIYECGQSYNGWNFLNLYYQEDPRRRIYQKKLISMAKQFLGLGQN